jgi:putative transposase
MLDWRLSKGEHFIGQKSIQARRLRELEKKNTRLKRLVADLSLDNAILKETAQGDF